MGAAICSNSQKRITIYKSQSLDMGNTVNNRGHKVHFYQPTVDQCEVVLPKGKEVWTIPMSILTFDLETRTLTIPACTNPGTDLELKELKLKLPLRVVKKNFTHLASLSGKEKEEVNDYREQSLDFDSYRPSKEDDSEGPYFLDLDDVPFQNEGPSKPTDFKHPLIEL